MPGIRKRYIKREEKERDEDIVLDKSEDSTSLIEHPLGHSEFDTVDTLF
jgi:hypothetical protein